MGEVTGVGMSDGPSETLFDRVGGRPFFDALVRRFYDAVEVDPVLRPLYPDDLTESIHHTAGFIAQYFGGGMEEYSATRGHPRLRMRHAPFAIGQVQRDAWLGHMTASVRAAGLEPELEQQMLDYFAMASTAMINTLE
jgi:hemoglobin